MNQTTAGLKDLVDHATAARRLFAMADLISDLAHHMNQPLAAIAAYADGSAHYLRSGTADLVDLLETAERISAEALRAAEFVRRLRERIRVAGIGGEAVDIGVLLADVLRSLEPAARRLDVPVLFDAGGPVCPILFCYAQGVARAFSTLLLRCLETAGGHAPHERVLRVKIALHTDPDAVEIGMGIGGYDPSAPSGDIVAESVPLDAACLAAEIVVVRSLIESHGGRLWVVAESRGLCSARLTLPVYRR